MSRTKYFYIKIKSFLDDRSIVAMFHNCTTIPVCLEVLARQDIMEYNNQSLSKLMVQLMDRLEGLANSTITKGTGMDVMKISLMSEEPIKELAPGKNIREYLLRHHNNDSSS